MKKNILLICLGFLCLMAEAQDLDKMPPRRKIEFAGNYSVTSTAINANFFKSIYTGKFIDTDLIKKEHQGDGKYSYRIYKQGGKNRFNQRYFIRNCIFEPLLKPYNNYVESCLKEIEIAFKWNKPANISSHRVNFAGKIDPKVRDSGVKDLKRLLKGIVQRWPDVEFMSSNELGELIRQSKAFVVNIDHHQDPEDFAQFRLWSTAAAATCELVYELIVELGDKNLIDKHIAACLYAGIMTDTGGFRHPNTTKNVHLVVAELLEAGADATAIANLIYDSNSLNRLKFIGFAITKRLVVREDLQLAYFVISKKDLKKYQSQTGDTEGLVNYALSLDGVKLAALFSEREDGVKISFRSSVDVAVNKFAAAHFGGGGHKNAAGGKSSLSLKKTVTRFESLVQEYQEDLFHSKEVPTL